jgi:hypothetical protein
MPIAAQSTALDDSIKPTLLIYFKNNHFMHVLPRKLISGGRGSKGSCSHLINRNQ